MRQISAGEDKANMLTFENGSRTEAHTRRCRRNLSLPQASGRSEALSLAREAAFYEALQIAEELLRRIDARWPRDRVPGKT
jgi:hypothetical protein